MVKISFIILQHNLPEETIECVDSVLNHIKKDFNIIIVDNCSEEENYKIIKKKYANNSKIDIVRIKENKGFSNGNNFGFEYTKKRYNPEFYYFISNDTLVTNRGLLKIIEEEYKKSKFDVFGADIVELDGKHVSPIKSNFGKSKLGVFLRFIILFIAQYIGIYLILYKIKNKFTKKQFSKLDHSKRKEDVAFQGAALLFSKKCFDKLPKPFHPETFFYMEEDILNYNRLLHNLKFVFNPKIKIIHKESATVNKLKRSKRKIMVFKLKNNLKSLKIFYNYMKHRPLPKKVHSKSQ